MLENKRLIKFGQKVDNVDEFFNINFLVTHRD